MHDFGSEHDEPVPRNHRTGFGTSGRRCYCAGAIQVARKVSRLIDSVEHNQIAPAGARVQSILDDVKAVTSVIKTNAGWIDTFIGRIFGRG
jgi:hypothetical protein